jgi:hypothetical protein
MSLKKEARVLAPGVARAPGSRDSRRRIIWAIAVTATMVSAGVFAWTVIVDGDGAAAFASPVVLGTAANVSLDTYGVSGGGSLEVTGTNFPGPATAKVSFVAYHDTAFPLVNGAPYPYNLVEKVHVNKAGEFSLFLDVPHINAGTYKVLASDMGTKAFANYYVLKGLPDTTTFSVSSHTVASGGCVQVSGKGYYLGDVENAYIGKPGLLYSSGTFDDTMKGTFSDQSICATYQSGGSTYGDTAGTYELMVVGDTSGIGVAKLTVTPAVV